jgi:hypothetical protein
MKITVKGNTKILIAKSGPVRTFGDYDGRKKMQPEELVRLFDNAWASGLDAAIARSQPCELEVARGRLKGDQRNHLRSSEEQRQFRYQEMEFIAQLKPAGGTGHELTQLWKVQSGDDYPKTIFVTFETVQQRQRFKDIAARLGLPEEPLALSILLDFMSKFDNLVPPKDL